MVYPNEYRSIGRLRARLARVVDPGIVEPHRVLGISRHETDPVQIILAAQIRLRRWRRLDPAEMSAQRRRRVHEIQGAREAMMQRAIERLTVTKADQPLTRTV
jgi:hypothetical protein